MSLIRKLKFSLSILRYYPDIQELTSLENDVQRPVDSGSSGKTRFRYLKAAYLGGAFNGSDRMKIAKTHYSVLIKKFKKDFLKKAKTGGIKLWEKQFPEDDAFDIKLRMPYCYNLDGELCLTMGCNVEDICVVSFVIAPGQIAGVADDAVLVITGIQGIAGKIEQIRKATDLCNNVSPANMLVAAAEAIAQSLGIKTMVGVGRSRVSGLVRSDVIFNYDAFWMPVVGVEEPAGLYLVPLPFKDKPIEAIQAKHRTRALKRRELRHVIRTDIMSSTQQVLQASALAVDIPQEYRLAEVA